MTENIEQIIADAIANGTPVKLRDGSKGFLKYDERKEPEVLSGEVKAGRLPIVGYRITEDVDKSNLFCWTGNGGYFLKEENKFDIIGAWAEPRPTRIINGIEVPAPLSWDEFKPDEDGEMDCFYIGWDTGINRAFVMSDCKMAFQMGILYATKEDAQANLNAYMKGTE